MTGCLLSATERGDQQLVKTLLKTFTHMDGVTNYLSLARVPTSERIPELAKTNRKEVHQILAAQIEYSMKFFNIPNGMTLEQIFLLTDTIIDDSESDNLSIQDVFIFLQKLSTGKMGTIYNRLDIPTFMELFEVHRQQRHEEIMNYRYEENVQFKALPINDRLADMFPDDEKSKMHNAMADYLRGKK
jgi:hypothetical protein